MGRKKVGAGTLKESTKWYRTLTLKIQSRAIVLKTDTLVM